MNLTKEELHELEEAHIMGVIDVMAFWAKYRENHETPEEKHVRLQKEFHDNCKGSAWRIDDGVRASSREAPSETETKT